MKKYFLIVNFIIILFFLITIPGCAKENDGEIEYFIGFKDLNTSFPEQKDLKRLIKTFDEWSDFCSKNPYYSEALNEKNNQKYFKSKSLIVYSFTRSTGLGSTEITRINKIGDQLQIDVEYSSGIKDALTKGLIIIEVKKSDVSDIIDLKIVETLI